MSESIEILAIKRIDDDRRVAHVRVGKLAIKSIWILNVSTSPRISWPETGRGYPIVEPEPDLRRTIDAMILERLQGAAAAAPRRRAPRKLKRSDKPFHDDPLDDLFKAGGG